MNDYKYIVKVEDETVAECYNTDTLDITIKGLFEKYFADPNLSITVLRAVNNNLTNQE